MKALVGPFNQEKALSIMIVKTDGSFAALIYILLLSIYLSPQMTCLTSLQSSAWRGDTPAHNEPEQKPENFTWLLVFCSSYQRSEIFSRPRVLYFRFFVVEILEYIHLCDAWWVWRLSPPHLGSNITILIHSMQSRTALNLALLSHRIASSIHLSYSNISPFSALACFRG